MTVPLLRVGIIGLGANTRLRHAPGLLACEEVWLMGVCNRRPESTAAAAAEFNIPKTYEKWEDLVADPELDAVVIGTWPYLHCPITLAALAEGKHVLCEARMAMKTAEAKKMLEASRKNKDLVCQLVPSPLGLRVDRVVKDLIAEGFLGQLREAVVIACNDTLADAGSPLLWRQVAEFSGINMLALGIVHETFIRWAPEPEKVFAHAHAFTPMRVDPVSGQEQRVSLPDSVQVLANLAGGASAMYHISGVTRFGPGAQIHLYGSEGTLRIELAPHERVFAGRRGDPGLQGCTSRRRKKAAGASRPTLSIRSAMANRSSSLTSPPA
jgi:predicted dehydrogenase